MSRDYTPTTVQVRDAYVRALRNAFIASAGEHEAEFDRWLARVKRDAVELAHRGLSTEWMRDQGDRDVLVVRWDAIADSKEGNR